MNGLQRVLASIQTKSLIKSGNTPIGQLKEVFDNSKAGVQCLLSNELFELRKEQMSKGLKYPKAAVIRAMDQSMLLTIEEAHYVYRDLQLKTGVLHCLEPNNIYKGFKTGKYSESLSMAYASNLTDALTGEAIQQFNLQDYAIGAAQPNRLLHVPAVTIFRGEHFDFLHEPITTDVIGIPAVNTANNERKWQAEKIWRGTGDIGERYYESLKDNLHAAFSLALREEIDVVIIEGGLGGKYDVIDAKKVINIFSTILNQKIFKYGFKYVLFAVPGQEKEVIDGFASIRK
ncbi:hypothetical protein ACOMCU_01640 [Lysinibacillus sp. UGB7]|uniref:hypothetical protein n=1 Tax=Lysinibacillus sp. UGB7 TaxID=3411039 RepID=UPI003B7E91E8